MTEDCLTISFDVASQQQGYCIIINRGMGLKTLVNCPFIQHLKTHWNGKYI